MSYFKDDLKVIFELIFVVFCGFILMFVLTFVFMYFDSDGLSDLCKGIEVGRDIGDFLNSIDKEFHIYGHACSDCRVLVKKGGLGLGTCEIEVGAAGKIISVHMDNRGP